MVSEVDRPGLLQSRSRARGQSLLGRDSTAEYHGPAPSRPCAQRLAAGHHRARAPDAGLQHAVAARHRSRRNRDAKRGREGPCEGWQGPSSARPRCIRRSRLAMARDVRRSNHEPVAQAGRVMRLEPRALHAGPGSFARGDESLCRSLQQGSHLPRQTAHQLVPAMRNGAVRSRSRSQGRSGQPLVHSLPARRRDGRDYNRNDAARDDARRHRGRA